MNNIKEIIKKEELKVDILLNSLTGDTFQLLAAKEKAAVEDSINDILQQNYLSLVNAIGHMAKLTKVDTRACGDIVALTSVVFSAVSERTHPSEAPQAVPKLMADSHNIMAQQYRLMADTLHVLARQFRAYESHHANKGDIEKAESNASFAKLAETVIEMVAGPKSVTITTDDIAKALQKNERSQPLDVKWESVPEGFNWAAKDRDGLLYLYTTEPHKVLSRWGNGELCKEFDREWLNSEPNVYWESSLTRRPE